MEPLAIIMMPLLTFGDENLPACVSMTFELSAAKTPIKEPPVITALVVPSYTLLATVPSLMVILLGVIAAAIPVG